jgi:hypothetical protein
MKVAVCISGHMRKFEQTFSSFNNHFLKHYDCDIFVHTWDDLGVSSAFKADTIHGSTENKKVKIEQLYNPKALIIEPSNFINELKTMAQEYAPHLINLPKPVYHMSSMFYKIYACNELRKYYERNNNIKYDWIVRTRPDLNFSSRIILSNTPRNNTVLIPPSPHHPQWYNDQFAIANSDEMDLYCSAFFDLPEYFRIGEEYYPEKFMMWSLNKKGLIKQSLPIHFNILR